MTITLSNAQEAAPVDLRALGRLVRCAARALRLRAAGALEITFIDSRRMRRLNRRFLSHDRPTDVLSFRYDLPAPRPVSPRARQAGGAPVVGEILIAPQEARRYARAHRVPYRKELARCVVHGLLHWTGQEDRTAVQQRRMRDREDELLERCC